MALKADQKLQSRFLNLKNPDEAALLAKTKSYMNANICTRDIAGGEKYLPLKSKGDKLPDPEKVFPGKCNWRNCK